MHGIRIVFIFAFAKELISYPLSPFTILIINIPKMENLRGVLWRAENALPPVFSLASYTMQLNCQKQEQSWFLETSTLKSGLYMLQLIGETTPKQFLGRFTVIEPK